MRLLGLSVNIATIATACLSGIGYILLVTHIEPFLRRVLPFTRTKMPDKFSTVIRKHSETGPQIIKGPSLHPEVGELDVTSFNPNIMRDPKGNWIHS